MKTNAGFLFMLAVFSLFLTACTIPTSRAVRGTFNYDAHAHFDRLGEATVYGQAFQRQRGGGVVYAAGGEMWLFPATEYGRAVVDVMRDQLTPTSIAPGFLNLSRKTTADGFGNFEFERVPSGTWIVAVRDFWDVYSGNYMTWMPQGGWIVAEVSVPSAGKARVIVHKKP